MAGEGGNNPAALGVLLATLAVAGVPGLSDQLLGGLKIPAHQAQPQAQVEQQNQREKKEGFFEKLKKAAEEKAQAKKQQKEGPKSFDMYMEPHEVYTDTPRYTRAARVEKVAMDKEEMESFYSDAEALRKSR